MYDSSLLTFMSRWLHAESHTDHVVFSTARVYTSGQQGNLVVVYWSQNISRIGVMDIDEFLDGRFLPLDYSPGKEDV